MAKETGELETLISRSEYKHNHESVILDIKSSGSEIIIMGTNAAINPVLWEETDITKIQLEKYLQFNSILEELALSYQVEYIDLWSAFSKSPGPGIYLQKDGIHPNENGMELISDLVEDRIEYLKDSF